MVKPVRKQNITRAAATSWPVQRAGRIAGSRQASAGRLRGTRTQSPSSDSSDVVPWVHPSGPPEVAVQVSLMPVGAISSATAITTAAVATMAQQQV